MSTTSRTGTSAAGIGSKGAAAAGATMAGLAGSRSLAHQVANCLPGKRVRFAADAQGRPLRLGSVIRPGKGDVQGNAAAAHCLSPATSRTASVAPVQYRPQASIRARRLSNRSLRA